MWFQICKSASGSLTGPWFSTNGRKISSTLSGYIALLGRVSASPLTGTAYRDLIRRIEPCKITGLTYLRAKSVSLENSTGEEGRPEYSPGQGRCRNNLNGPFNMYETILGRAGSWIYTHENLAGGGVLANVPLNLEMRRFSVPSQHLGMH